MKKLRAYLANFSRSDAGQTDRQTTDATRPFHKTLTLTVLEPNKLNNCKFVQVKQVLIQTP